MDTSGINTGNLEDPKVNIRIKLSALWASVTFFYIYGDYFELYVPDKLQGMVIGNSMLNSPVKLFAASILLAIPALMVCFSILLKPRINRGLNLVFGIFFTAIMLLIAVTSISEWRVFYVFYAIVESVLTSVIVVCAWNWAKV
jgi:hypothetical protein